jgi:hypothetical protein
MSKTKKPQGKCVFCNGTGLTKEHIFSDWLKTLLTRTADYGVLYRQNQIDPSGRETLRTASDRESGSVHSRRVRVVCRSCNIGWMSDMVKFAKPVSAMMIDGTATSLDRTQMTALASWVTLASMMAEFSVTKEQRIERIIPADDLDYIRQHHRPPPTWVVFLGRYDGRTWGPIRFHRHRYYPYAPESTTPIVEQRLKPFRFQVTTYNLEHLLVQTFCTQDSTMASLYNDCPRPASLIRIWPPDLLDAQWPAGPALDDGEAQHLADEFYEAVQDAHRHM